MVDFCSHLAFVPADSFHPVDCGGNKKSSDVHQTTQKSGGVQLTGLGRTDGNRERLRGFRGRGGGDDVAFAVKDTAWLDHQAK